MIFRISASGFGNWVKQPFSQGRKLSEQCWQLIWVNVAHPHLQISGTVNYYAEPKFEYATMRLCQLFFPLHFIAVCIFQQKKIFYFVYIDRFGLDSPMLWIVAWSWSMKINIKFITWMKSKRNKWLYEWITFFDVSRSHVMFA